MKVDFEKYTDRLVPTIVQDSSTGRVLMLGFMNRESLERTRELGKVTFFSRSRQKLWTKGESSGNFLTVKEIILDCDADTLLIKADPSGVVCHNGWDTCFRERNASDNVLVELEEVIRRRKTEPSGESYTSGLFAEGLNRIAQKVGEEAIELVIESKDDNREKFKNEAADLLFHLIVLLTAKDVRFDEVLEVLRERKR